MKALIRRCRSEEHDDTVYSLGDSCPRCGASTENTAPPPFSPDDPYGDHRRNI